MKNNIKFFLVAIVLLFISACSTTKIACVGDSITYGAGIKHRDSLSYPQQMQRMMGQKYTVKNFGVNGATMLKKGDKPYWKEPQYEEVLKFKPKVIILTLGTNDSKPFNWDDYGKDFKKDYLAMISKFQSLASKPKIYIGLPPPVIKNRWGIRKEIVEKEIPKILKEIAREKGLETIDFYDMLTGADHMFPDNIHPDAAGANRMAIVAIAKVLTTFK